MSSPRHFCQLDKDGIVIMCIVAESVEWCEQWLGGRWVETDPDEKNGKNFAGIGHKYHEDKENFSSTKPHDSWVLDEQSCKWKPPVTLKKEYTEAELHAKWNDTNKTLEIVETDLDE